MTVFSRFPSLSSFLITVLLSAGSRSLTTVRSCVSPTVTPAPTGPARTPTSSANAGAEIAQTTPAANRYFFMTSPPPKVEHRHRTRGKDACSRRQDNPINGPIGLDPAGGAVMEAEVEQEDR